MDIELEQRLLNSDHREITYQAGHIKRIIMKKISLYQHQMKPGDLIHILSALDLIRSMDTPKVKTNAL